MLAGSLALLGVSLYLVLSVSPFSVPDFKKLHAILGIRESKIIETRVSPAGSWLTLDDYTEYDDVSMTNNYGSTASASPPRAWGLYRDAARVTPLLKQLPTDFSYLAGSLPYLPYVLRPRPRVLLVGTNGGFKMVESSHSGAVSGLALEQPGDIYRFVRERLQAVAPEWERAWGFRLQRGTIFSLPRDAQGSFDLIEVASDFLSQDSNNSWSFTLEAMEGYLRALKPGGILSIPVDISEFNVYALKMVDTMSAALARRGLPTLPAASWHTARRGPARSWSPTSLSVPRTSRPWSPGAPIGPSTHHGTPVSTRRRSTSGTTCRPSPSSRGKCRSHRTPRMPS